VTETTAEIRARFGCCAQGGTCCCREPGCRLPLLCQCSHRQPQGDVTAPPEDAMPAAGTPAPAVTAPVPPEAVTAGMVEAAQAYDLAHRSNYVSWTRPPDYQVARLITGAAGLIREDERER